MHLKTILSIQLITGKAVDSRCFSSIPIEIVAKLVLFNGTPYEADQSFDQFADLPGWNENSNQYSARTRELWHETRFQAPLVVPVRGLEGYDD